MKNLLFILIISLLTLNCSGDGEPRKPGKIDAWVYTEMYMENQLKAPKTAEFCSYSRDRVQLIDTDTYKVKGYVDSQNSFGAMIRTNYTFVIKNLGGKYKWKVISIDTN